MNDAEDIHTLDEVLDRIGHADEDGLVCVGYLVSAMGQRSFGTLLLVPSLLLVSPLSAIPGVSSVTGIVIALIAVQMLVGRDAVWLPRRINECCIDRRRFEKALAFLAPIARFCDKLVWPRLSVLTYGPCSRFVAAVCVLVGLLMPVFEMVPFASSILAAVVATFAFALVARDGVLVIVATVVTAAALYFAFSAVF